MLLIGGLFGVIVGTRITGDLDLKQRVISFSTKWIIPAALLAPFLMWWYWTTLPESAVALVKGGAFGVAGGKLEAITRHLWLVLSCSALIVLGAVLIAARPRAATTAGAIALFLVAQLGVMGAEFFREMARKPYVIYGVLYSNSLWARDADDATKLQASYLEAARWDPEVEPLSSDHGEWVFRLQCANCHTRTGYRSLTSRTETWTTQFGQEWLTRMHETGVMPPFNGDASDRGALAAYLVSLHTGATTTPTASEQKRDSISETVPSPLVDTVEKEEQR
jgi:mono/diheme cytochrome c family protein